MYLDFYGLNEKPFNITPNPRFVFLSKHHREVFAHLLFGIRRHSGFIEVTGEVGTGKTTVLRTLFAELEKTETRIAYIFNPCLSAIDLLRAVNREFGLDPHAAPAELHAELNALLLREHAAGRTVVLVIDEAQNLEPAVLEQVRLLSNLETETDKLIQIVLVGQPELGVLLDRPELRQLSQRVTVRYHLLPMDQDDTAAYIEHRLSVAGWTRGHLFSSEAIRRIYRATRGNPRLINILCDRALLVGYAEGLERIGPAEVRKAERELRRKTAISLPVPALWLLLLVPLVAAGFWVASRQQSVPVTAAAPPAALAANAFATDIVPALRSTISADERTAAVSALLGLWGAQPVRGEAQTIEAALDLSRDQRFAVARLSGDLDGLLRIELPMLLELSLDGAPRYLLLHGEKNGALRVALASGRALHEVPRQELLPYWSGRAYLLWRNPLGLPVVKGPLRETGQITALQTLLGQAGQPVPRSGRYDSATSSAVRTFQATHGLPADGIAGLQTLIALYRQSGAYGYPQWSNREAGR